MLKFSMRTNNQHPHPEANDKESFYTKIVNLYHNLSERYPDIIGKLDDLPKRIKVTKANSQNVMFVFFKKNRLYVKSVRKVDNEIVPNDSSLEEVLDIVKCESDTPSLPINDDFWILCEKAKEENVVQKIPTSELSLERKALNNYSEELVELKPFLRVLREDILDYVSLPVFTLRRIAKLKLNNVDSTINWVMIISKRKRKNLKQSFAPRTFRHSRLITKYLFNYEFLLISDLNKIYAFRHLG